MTRNAPPRSAEDTKFARSAVDMDLDLGSAACVDCRRISAVADIGWELRARFPVYGKPVPQPRPRVYGHVTVADSPASRAWKKEIARVASENRCSLNGPVRCDILCVLQRPKSLHGRRYPAGLIPHVKKPDIDNLCKAVLDGLWPILGTDSAVCALAASKYYGAKSMREGCLVTIWERIGGDHAVVF